MELSLPAGSLEAAIAGFKGGADSVYLGMKDFSARKKAQNFTFEDLSKLKAMAVSLGKKIYVTINTIIYPQEIEELMRILRQLEYLQVDGLIIQDLALVKLVREYFPSLALHASTQLAVHTVKGVRLLQSLGFERIVLARELSFREISYIRKECPDVELKVFIHGAMCYGFSGLCEASRLITGRSANRGECAQICRTWFTCKQNSKDAYFFSMKDLEIGEGILELQKMGIESVKVEGRMKSPAYCYAVARYYRLLLDGNASETELSVAREAMETTFLRDHGDGYFTGSGSVSKSGSLVCPDYSQHKGIEAGRIRDVSRGRMLVELSHPVALRDGLLYVNSSIHRESPRWALMEILDQNGKRRSFAGAGETVSITVPKDCQPKPDQPVFLISLHNQNPENIKTDGLPLFKRPIPLSFQVFRSSIKIKAIVFGQTFEEKYPLDLQEASKPSDFVQILTQTFKASAQSFFTLSQATADLASCPFENIFCPISALKEIRRKWYSDLDAFFDGFLRQTPPAPAPCRIQAMSCVALPPREALGLWDRTVEIDEKKYLPLCPVMTDEESYFSSLENTLASDPEIIVGLNNIAQVQWASEHPEVQVFIDVYLYVANRFSAEVFARLLPNLFGCYYFMEAPARKVPFGDWPFVPTDASSFVPPLFISRACFNRHSLGQSCTTCKGAEYSLSQNGKSYDVSTNGCLTVVTQAAR